METNKPKQLPYQDDFEFWRNMARIMMIVAFNPIISFLLAQDSEGAKEFLYTFADWPLKYYFFFFLPLFISLHNLDMVWLEKKSGVPMPRVSKHFIYASWVVSLVFYGSFVVALFS